MREFFEVRQAAKTILKDMYDFSIGFDRAWQNYNSEWFLDKLSEQEKEATKQFIETKMKVILQ